MSELTKAKAFLSESLYLLSAFAGCPRPSTDVMHSRPKETVTKLNNAEIEKIYDLFERIDDWENPPEKSKNF